MPFFGSLDSIQAKIISGNLSCVSLVEHYLENITSNQKLNAFIEVFDDEAILRAKEIDKKFQNGTQGKLAGLVVGIKDLLCYQDHKVSAASKMLEGFTSLYSATAVKRLLEEDVIIIGRQNCDEFGMGSASENSAYGSVKNGLDATLVSGGSSGGSAVAVQMNMCAISLGTDTGGSVRQPSAFCGVIGLKPTYSRVSRYGLVAYGSSFDTIGVISHNVEDNKKVLDTIAGFDEKDSTSSNLPIESKSETVSKRFCYYKELINTNLGNQERLLFEKLIVALKDAGHTVEAVSFPLLDYVVPTYYLLTMAEASSNLSRYDGVRYGQTAVNAKSFNEQYSLTRSHGFGDEVKRRILLGTFVLSSGYYDAYVTKAQKVRNLIRQDTVNLFKDYDFLISPTTPTTAFELGKERSNPTEVYLEDIFTVQASLAGIPAISIPFQEKINNLPFGIQVSANEFEENALYSIAEDILKSGM